MITVKAIRALVEESKTTPAIFAPELPDDVVVTMKDESSFTQDFFLSIAESLEVKSISEDDAELKIRNFLSARGHSLLHTNIAFLRHPFLPVNQLCLKVAEALAKPDEPVYQILLPSVKGLNRASYNLKSETEDKGHFPIEQFLLSSDGTMLIPVGEIFAQAFTNTNLIFPEFQKVTNEVQYTLTESDFFALEQIAGNASKEYMRALRAEHLFRHEISLGQSIKELASSLKKGSVTGIGTEEQAESMLVAGAIKEFYDLWFALDADKREEVGKLILTNYGNAGVTLNQYFMVLFYGHPHCQLTDEQRAQAKKDKIFTCIDIIANILDQYLIQHADVLYGFGLNANQRTKVTNLKELATSLDKALMHRPQLLTGADQNLFVQLYSRLFSFYVPFDIKSTSFLGNSHDSVEVPAFSAKLAQFIHTGGQLEVVLNRHSQGVAITPLIKLLKPRLNDLIKDPNLFIRVLSISSPDLQKELLASLAHFCIPENKQYFQALLHALSPENKGMIEQFYLNVIERTITQGISGAISLKAFPYLLESIDILDDDELIDQLIYRLNPKLKEIMTERIYFSRLFLVLSERSQKIVIDSFLPLFIEWCGYPSFYQSVTTNLMTSSRSYLNSRIAFVLAKRIVDWSTFIKVIQVCDKLVNVVLIGQFMAKLAEWMDDSHQLLLVMQHTLPLQNVALIKQFHPLIKSVNTCAKALSYIPSDCRLAFFSLIDFDTFIISHDQLHDLLCLVKNSKESDAVLDQLDLTKLKPSQNKLVICPSDLENFPVIQTFAMQPALTNEKKLDSSEWRQKFLDEVRDNPSMDREYLTTRVKFYMEKIAEYYSTPTVSFFGSSVSFSGGPMQSKFYSQLNDLLKQLELHTDESCISRSFSM